MLPESEASAGAKAADRERLMQLRQSLDRLAGWQQQPSPGTGVGRKDHSGRDVDVWRYG